MNHAVVNCPRCRSAFAGKPAPGAMLTCDTCGLQWQAVKNSDDYLPEDESGAVPIALTERHAPVKVSTPGWQATPSGLPFDKLEEESRRGGRSPLPVSELAFRPSTDGHTGDRSSCPVCGHGFVGLANTDDQKCPACGTQFHRASGRLTAGGQTGTDRLIGRVLRGCQIDRKLGEGGMGAVYHARQLSLDRSVAIKVLPPDLARNRNFIQRFEREAKSLARINHANILQIYDFGDDPQLGVYFMVIEYVDGWDLGEVLRRQPTLSQIETLDILRQAMLGLEQVAAQGVIHRDIKPDNLMVAISGLCKVSDFGLAKGSASDSEVTSVGVRVGTPAFMSPEQCDGVEVDTRSDVYNLGCTAFLMLTGHLPYDGETPFSIMLKHKVDPVPSVRTYRPEIDLRVDALIRRMMQKKPGDRCSDLRELVDDAEHLLVALTGTASVLRKTNGPIRALVEHASGQGSSGKRKALSAVSSAPDGGSSPMPVPRASGRQRSLAATPASPAPAQAAGAPTAIPDWLRPVDAAIPLPPAAGPPPASASRSGPAPAISSRSGPAPAVGSRSGPMRTPVGDSAGASRAPPPTLATPFPGMTTPLPGEHKNASGSGSGSGSSLLSGSAIDRARDRGIKAEVATIASGAERLASSGNWEAAAGEWKRAAHLARDTSESQRLGVLAKQAAKRASNRRRGRGMVIGAVSAALLGINLWIWPPVAHNLLAERERTRLEALPEPSERSRKLREFAAANQGGWRWYRMLFNRSYEVPAATAAASGAMQSLPLSLPQSQSLPRGPQPPSTPKSQLDAAALVELAKLAADPAVPLQRLVAAAKPLASDAQAAAVLADSENRLAAATALRKAIDTSRAQGRHGEALDLAARLPGEQPRAGALLAGLPLPGRIRASDVDTRSLIVQVKLLVDGIELVGDDGRFCRSASADVQLDVGAAGYAVRRLVVAAASEPGERVVEAALGPAPLWRVPAPASRPDWLRLHAIGMAVAVVTGDAAATIDAATGTLRLLTTPGTKLVPWWVAGDGCGSFATADGEQRQILPTLDRAVPVRRLAVGPLALIEIDLIYRAGSRLAVSIEDTAAGRFIVARDGAREAWRLPGVAGTSEPLLRRADDKLVVIDDLTLHVLEEDGSETASLPLKAVRSGPWTELPGGRLLLATTTGIELVQLGKGGARLLPHPWLAEAGVAIPAAAGEAVVLARADHAVDIATWATDPVKPSWRAKVPGRPLQATVANGLTAIADDGGLITIFRLADGRTLRRIAHGVPVMAPPLLLPGLVVIADQTGAVAGYRIPD